MSSLKPWTKVGSRPAGHFGIFTIRTDRKVSPRTHREHEFHVIESVNWVNVVALTEDNHVVMIEQYRHGSNTIELEIPGGMVDPKDASPIAAGVRELREETGYEGQNPGIIGQVWPNPAIMNNACFTVLVEQCRCVHPLEWDHGEDIATRLVPVEQVPKLVADGTIKHSLVVAALFYFDLHRRRL